MRHSPDAEGAKAILFGAPMQSHKSNSRRKSRDGLLEYPSQEAHMATVAGRAQILVVPDLEAGNMLAKNLTFLN